MRTPARVLFAASIAAWFWASVGCHTASQAAQPDQVVAAAAAPTTQPAAKAEEKKPPPRRYTYTPKVYPVDERGFSPVGKALEKAMAREEMIQDDEEGSLNPYVMKVISTYPLDGSYPYHCGWTPREYDIYNGVTEDMVFKGLVVAKAYPDGSRCSYCCGFTFEVFIRAMKLRNIQKGLDPDDFNGMTFNDLFNMLQLWYIEGPGDCERRAITSYGLGRAIEDFEDVKPGDFLSYSTTPPGGHAVIFIEWIREPAESANQREAPAGRTSANQPEAPARNNSADQPEAQARENSNRPRAGGGDSVAAAPRGGREGGSTPGLSAAPTGKGKIIGMRYFSSNLSGSKGVGYGQGKFADSNNGRGYIRKSLRIARVGAIKDYKPFNRLDIPARNAYLPTQPTRIIYVPSTQPVGG